MELQYFWHQSQSEKKKIAVFTVNTTVRVNSKENLGEIQSHHGSDEGAKNVLKISSSKNGF